MKIAPTLFLSLLLASTFSERGFAQLQAPGFTLLDADGNEVAFSDYAGQPLILHFWATWCPYCERLQPGLESLYQDFKADGLEVLAISFSEREPVDPQRVLEARGISFKTLLNGDQVAARYGVLGTPTTFFITRGGAVLWATNFSDPNDPRFEDAVAYLLDH